MEERQLTELDAREGMTHQQIAEILGISAGRVPAIERQAITKLRRLAYNGRIEIPDLPDQPSGEHRLLAAILRPAHRPQPARIAHCISESLC